jgi:hypothetical protein
MMNKKIYSYSQFLINKDCLNDSKIISLLENIKLL